jgi:predicted O-linked N-acetylglucosamine transferase (SPINDLY family)
MADPLSDALALHEAGRLSEAEPLYMQALAADPNSAKALHFLGMLMAQTRRPLEGLPLMQRSVAIDPQSILYRSNTSAILTDVGRPVEALQLLAPALQSQTPVGEIYDNAGLALLGLNRVGDAISAFQRAISINANNVMFLFHLGIALQRAEDHAGALAAFSRVSSSGARVPHLYSMAGRSLVRMARWQEALDAYKRALEADPNNSDVQIDIANILIQLGRLDEAAAALESMIRRDPVNFDAMHNLAYLRHRQARLDEAVAWYEKSAALRPAGDLFGNMGGALLAQGRHADAIVALRRAATFSTKYASALLAAMHYTDLVSPAEIAAEHANWGAAVMREVGAPRAITPPPLAGRRLRIGYVSPDFRQHAVARFLEPLLANHDRSAFEIFGLSATMVRDPMTERLRGCCDQWHEIMHLSDAAAAEKIASLEIDILVDLAGHTSGTRLGIFARKPAPLQGTYLGYPDTTGLPTVDFRITDMIADPPGMTEAFHTEKLARLERCFLCFQPPMNAPAITPLPAEARGGAGVTFASFAAFEKMTPTMFEAWAEILHRVPKSRLLLKRSPLSPGQSARGRVLENFARHGVAESRIELEGGTLDEASHLARYAEVDIMLDTFPYAGTTMTFESLWMGVPVITLAGGAHVSRVGASILTYADLPELIATSPKQYVELAAALAGDLPRLASLRAALRGKLQSSTLLIGIHMAGAVEKLYTQLWRERFP